MTDTLAETTPVASPATTRGSLQRGAAVLTVATVVIGLANYGMALLMARLLRAEEFARFASGQGLLLVIGTGSMAALPWAISHYLSDPASERDGKRALHLGLVGSGLQAVVLGGLAYGVGFALDGPAFALTVGGAVVFISLLSGPIGFFQGRGDYTGIAVARLVETVVRIVVGLAVVLLVSRSAVGGLTGFAVGSAIAVGWLVWRARDTFPLRRMPGATTRRLARQAVLLGAIQVLLAVLGALDTVFVTTGHLVADDAASYQTAALIGRVPLFVSQALALAGYTSLVSAHDRLGVGRVLRSCMSTFSWACVPFAIACLTFPSSLFYTVVPPAYTAALPLLRVTAFVGIAIGMINIVTTAHQARSRFRSGLVILLAGTAVQAVALVLAARSLSVTAFAVLDLVVAAGTLAALLVDARGWLTVHLRANLPRLAAVSLFGAGAVLFRSSTPLWLVMIAGAAAACLTHLVHQRSAPTRGRHQRKAAS